MVEKLDIDSIGVSSSAYRQRCFSSITNESLKSHSTRAAIRHVFRRLVCADYLCFGHPMLEETSSSILMASSHYFSSLPSKSSTGYALVQIHWWFTLVMAPTQWAKLVFECLWPLSKTAFLNEIALDFG